MKISFKWNKKAYDDFIKYLENIKDPKNKEFNERIIETKYEMLGIKMPVLKTIAKDISKTNFFEFFELCENKYYEEVMIQGLLLSYIKDDNLFLEQLREYVYKIDSWALCDSCVLSYKIMKKNDYSDIAYSFILDSHEYVQRVGYVILLNYYVDDNHINDILSLCQKESDYYYVNMAISWLISVCFVKCRSNTLELLKSKKLNPVVQNKAISKIRESFRVSKDDKELVKKYKI